MADGTPVHKDFAPMSAKRCPRDAERGPHHLKERSQGGTHEPENLLDLCWWNCHSWIKPNPKLARERGLLK